jgi:hypothetical protein
MINSSRNNQFDFRFPRTFVPDEIKEKYNQYLNRIPGNMISEPIDYLNYGIQSINLPGISFDPIEQTAKIGRKRLYRASGAKEELLSKELTVTVQLLDGYINYFMYWDIFNYYYCQSTPELYLPEGTSIQLLDSSGNVIIIATLERLLFTSISSLDLSFSNNIQEFNTFEISFVYNDLKFKSILY